MLMDFIGAFYFYASLKKINKYAQTLLNFLGSLK